MFGGIISTFNITFREKVEVEVGRQFLEQEKTAYQEMYNRQQQV